MSLKMKSIAWILLIRRLGRETFIVSRILKGFAWSLSCQEILDLTNVLSRWEFTVPSKENENQTGVAHGVNDALREGRFKEEVVINGFKRTFSASTQVFGNVTVFKKRWEVVIHPLGAIPYGKVVYRLSEREVEVESHDSSGLFSGSAHDLPTSFEYFNR